MLHLKSVLAGVEISEREETTFVWRFRAVGIRVGFGECHLHARNHGVGTIGDGTKNGLLNGLTTNWSDRHEGRYDDQQAFHFTLLESFLLPLFRPRRTPPKSA